MASGQWEPVSIKIKCVCGYKNNGIDDLVCQMCSQKLDPNNRWSDRSPPPSSSKARGPGVTGATAASTLGVNRSVERGAARAIKTKNDGPSEDQIVYVGDFAIVYLFVISGGGRIILTPGEVFTFGRSDNADHKIDGKQVSRRHARIHWSGDNPEIVDLDSKNGILVNGQPAKRKPLEDGDEIAIGAFHATMRVVPANDLDGQLDVPPDRLSATTVSNQRLMGEVRLVMLSWLLQHLERLHESGTLTVYGEEAGGYVAFISGVPIAAGFGPELEITGEEAIVQITRIRNGRFCFSPHADAAPQSIGKTVSEILGAQRAGQPPTQSFARQQGGSPGPSGAPPGPPLSKGGRRIPPPPGRRRPPPPGAARRPPPTPR